MSDLSLNIGDTLPALQATLTGADGATPVVLSAPGTSVLVTLLDASTGAVVVQAPCVIGPAAGVVTYQWQPADTAVARSLNARFTVTFPGGGIQTFPAGGSLSVDIVDPANMPPVYFELDELRVLPNMGDLVKYPDSRAMAARASVEATIERVCQTAFVPRPWTDVLDGDEAGRHGALRLTKTWILSVTAVTLLVTGPLSAADLAGLAVYREGSVERRMTSALYGDDYDGGFAGTSGDGYGPLVPWPPGRKNITISYLYGYSSVPPDDLKQAAIQATRQRLLRVDGASGIPDRALSLTNDFGNVQLASANNTNRPFGLPEVDAVVMGWADLVRIPGIA